MTESFKAGFEKAARYETVMTQHGAYIKSVAEKLLKTPQLKPHKLKAPKL